MGGRGRKEILLYVPNLIGYARLVLLGAGIAFFQSHPPTFLGLYLLQMSLDMVDGYLARLLSQESRVGAVLDVVADNGARTMMYMCAVANAPFSPLSSPPFLLAYLSTATGIIVLEWITFASSHGSSLATGVHWKVARSGSPQVPWLLRTMFANGFKNPLGAWVILSIAGLPMAMYVATLPWDWIPPLLFLAVAGTLVLGRVLGIMAETYVISQHIHLLLDLDLNDDLPTPDHEHHE